MPCCIPVSGPGRTVRQPHGYRILECPSQLFQCRHHAPIGTHKTLLRNTNSVSIIRPDLWQLCDGIHSLTVKRLTLERPPFLGCVQFCRILPQPKSGRHSAGCMHPNYHLWYFAIELQPARNDPGARAQLTKDPSSLCRLLQCIKINSIFCFGFLR